jgi:phospholipid-translocating ATPase
MSPLQKSEIVRMMKNSPAKPITAAIGDGGNDVAMIQEAHVGLGIMGREGRAAVRSSDFAFAKFRFLQKVILVHGHWYYYRVALLVHYFFYKNVACFGGQLFYCFYNNFSIQKLYDSFNLTFYNIIWTSAPIFVFALLEQNLDKETLLRHPEFYRRIRQNRMMRRREFLLWFLYSLWHAVAVFFGWVMDKICLYSCLSIARCSSG